VHLQGIPHRICGGMTFINNNNNNNENDKLDLIVCCLSVVNRQYAFLLLNSLQTIFSQMCVTKIDPQHCFVVISIINRIFYSCAVNTDIQFWFMNFEFAHFAPVSTARYTYNVM